MSTSYRKWYRLAAILSPAATVPVMIVLHFIPQSTRLIEVPDPVELSERRDSLEDVVSRLTDSINTLELRKAEIEDALSYLADSLPRTVPVDQTGSSIAHRDKWFVSMAKTVLVCIVLPVTVVLTPFAIVADIIVLVFGASFPVTRALWHLSWDTIVLSWYWQHASTLGVFLGAMLVFSGSGGETARTTRSRG